MNGNDFARTTRTIGNESARLAPVVERINGKNVRDKMTETFESAAGSFARGKYSREEFHGITGNLIRDAWALITEQDRTAAAYTLDTSGVLTSGSKRRKSWATMPTDGSGPGKWERIIVWTVLATCGMVVGWLLYQGFSAFLTSPVVPMAPVGTGASVAEVSTEWEFGTPRVTLDMTSLPSGDCWYEVTMTDADGEPGGGKTTHVEPFCP